MKEFTDRVVKPLLLPLGAGAFIFVLAWSLSRILLAVPEAGSTALALLIAAEVLGVSAVIAAASGIKNAQKLISVVLGFALMGGGGVAAAIGEREIGHEEGAEFHVTGENIEFVEDTLQVPADDPFELAFENLDAGVPHNVAIYSDDSASDALFVGEIFNGVETRTYEVPALPQGEWFFRCDVHPQMTGTVIAGEGGPAPPSDVDATIVAKDIQFDKELLELPAGVPTVIEFQNNDPNIPHNVAIYTDSTAAEEVFIGEIFNGVDSRRYELPPIDAGEYFFRCDVHPNMRGTAVFQE